MHYRIMVLDIHYTACPTVPKNVTVSMHCKAMRMDRLLRAQSKTLRSILNAHWYINNHRIHEDLQTNTVISEIKKWNTKDSENCTNALAVNLLDNNETTHRLKRYTVLTLQDKPESNPNTRIKMIPK
jgi:hypothetical protein